MRYRVCERFELLVGPLQLTIGRLELGRAIREPLQERGVLEAQAPHRQRARQHRYDRPEVERLENVVEGAALHGLDRRVDRAMAGHQEAHQVGVNLLCRAQQRDAVHARHHEVGNQDVEGGGTIGRRGAQGAERFRAGTRSARRIARSGQGVAQGDDLGALIIHYQEPGERRGIHGMSRMDFSMTRRLRCAGRAGRQDRGPGCRLARVALVRCGDEDTSCISIPMRTSCASDRAAVFFMIRAR